MAHSAPTLSTNPNLLSVPDMGRLPSTSENAIVNKCVTLKLDDDISMILNMDTNLIIPENIVDYPMSEVQGLPPKSGGYVLCVILLRK